MKNCQASYLTAGRLRSGFQAWLPSVVFAAALVGAASDTAAQTQNQTGRDFLAQFCFDCHKGESPEAGLNLETMPIGMADAEVRRRWTHLYDRVVGNEMPPQSADVPSDRERRAFLSTLADEITAADRADREVILRRLNRDEYTNTVRDLFGIYVDVSRILVDDANDNGFDNIGSELALSGEQMTLYLQAADAVLDQVFGPAQKPRQFQKTLHFKDFWAKNRADVLTDDGGTMFGSRPVPVWNTSVPEAGSYRVKIRAKAVQTTEPVVMRVNGGLTGNIAPHVAGFFEVAPGDLSVIQFVDRAREKSDSIQLSYDAGFPHWKLDAENYKGAGLLIQDVEIEGPLEPWPPASRRELLGGIDPDQGTLDDVRATLGRILPKAFRRPTDDREIEPFIELARQALEEGLSFEKALRRGLKGILCAPEFLFMEERADEPSRLSDTADVSIDQSGIASRLSYFLWRSMPDQELFALARRGQLRKPEVLKSQVERMLADQKSERFVGSFTGQWLRLRDIDFTVPDRRLYPEYSQLLRRSMLDETHSFFREVLDKDLSVQNFLDSDFVMINQPLAEFYGIGGVKGLKMRRVELPRDSVRGGVLTQASVLKVSADGTRTSPVLRGVWILKHLFGTPAPPPPSTVAAVEPDIRGATTIREQLAKHRADPSCNRCHRKIDPPGFALESFDVIGAHRDWYRTRDGKYFRKLLHPHSSANVLYRKGQDVDSSGVMADGREFSGIREYKQLLLENETRMARSLTKLLLSYSLGREAGFSDRPEVERIVAQVRQEDFGLRSIIHAVVQSRAFHSR